MEKVELIRSLVNREGRGLEVGPSYSPMFPKRDGFHVDVADYTSEDGLREKYKVLGVDTAAIEVVDYVSDGRKLHEVIPHRCHYDFIFSSHSIEHVTDVLGFLKSCELLLKRDGVLVLVVPDHRYVFDVLQNTSTTGEVLEAHALDSSRHSPAAIFDFAANMATLDGLEYWPPVHRGELKLSIDIQAAKSLFDRAVETASSYIDVHGWRFTPASFRLILHDLNTLGLTSLREVTLVDRREHEFIVALSLAGKPSEFGRLELHRQRLREQVESGVRFL